jgi:FlaA1/EpsC-like NDP-sugar epimerase
MFFRIPILLFLYTACAVVSLWLAWELRFGFYDIDGIPEQFRERKLLQFAWIIPLKLLALYAFGQFNGLLRFFRLPDAIRLFAASTVVSGGLVIGWVFTGIRFVPPASIVLTDFILFTFLVISARVGIRIVDEKRKGFLNRAHPPKRVAIVGAGEAGSALAGELLSRPDLRMRPVAFFDDDPKKHGKRMHGIPIVGKPEAIVSFFKTNDLNKVVLAIPHAPSERLRAIINLLTDRQIPVETIPATDAVISGRYRTTLTRRVRIEDLLYRDPVRLEWDRIESTVRGKVIWITGAGGSIGSEIARQVASMGPKMLVLIDNCEGALFQIENQLRKPDKEVAMRCHVVDVRDGDRIRELLTANVPDYVYHAAAYKHVEMMQRQPWDAFCNNTVATLNFAQLAIEAGVGNFCLISTDKAVTPGSVMGYTKRLAEGALLELSAPAKNCQTAFTIVRFGNVLGSSGSVIPIFERQIAEGGPVTVTDVRATRFFMTIPEAVGLVLQAVSFGEKQGLYMLDMGEPISIDAMARDLIRLKGLEPDKDIKIVYTGLRDGEKLQESLYDSEEEILLNTAHPKIHRVQAKADSLPRSWIQEIAKLQASGPVNFKANFPIPKEPR